MNGFLISVVILLACAAGAAFAIRRLGRATQSGRDSYLYPDAHRLAYRAIGRLHHVEDERFLKLQSGVGKRLRQRLRAERSLALGLYLDQIRDEFGHACGQAREFAARNEDPNAASAIFRQELQFRALYFIVRCQNAFGWSRGGRAAKLLDFVESIQLSGAEASAAAPTARLG